LRSWNSKGKVGAVVLLEKKWESKKERKMSGKRGRVWEYSLCQCGVGGIWFYNRGCKGARRRRRWIRRRGWRGRRRRRRSGDDYTRGTITLINATVAIIIII